jgi:SAM-dependent methyltransferase
MAGEAHPGADAALHTLRPTERFADRAADYVRCRPTYPPEAVDAVLYGLGDPGQLVAADVGAGTGISARLLAARGVRVLAVEPNAAMRAAAEAHPLVSWHDGRAEATGLPDACAGLVLCAQSFHWFEPEAALREFHRVLAPGGRLALVWNDRDRRDGATAEFSRLVTVACRDDPASRRHVRPEALFRSPWFEGARALELANAQRLDAEGLVGRATSASYVPRSGPLHDELVAGLRAMVPRFGDAEGRVAIRYVTHVYLADARGLPSAA